MLFPIYSLSLLNDVLMFEFFPLPLTQYYSRFSVGSMQLSEWTRAANT